MGQHLRAPSLTIVYNEIKGSIIRQVITHEQEIIPRHIDPRGNFDQSCEGFRQEWIPIITHDFLLLSELQ